MKLNEIQDLINSGAITTYTPPPLVNRCKCGRVISETRAYCYACITAEMARHMNSILLAPSGGLE